MKRTCLLFALSAAWLPAVHAEGLSSLQNDTMKQLIATYAAQAKAEAVASKGRQPASLASFSVENGRQIYLRTRNWEGDEISACSTCHTDDPKAEGRHAVSKKSIRPLAPAVNPKRFTDRAKVEKNFSEHCHELYNRDCSAAEKGNFLTYLMSVR